MWFTQPTHAPNLRVASGGFVAVEVRPHGHSLGRGTKCQRPRPGYDTLTPRGFLFVPSWGMMAFLAYAMRRFERIGFYPKLSGSSEGASRRWVGSRKPTCARIFSPTST